MLKNISTTDCFAAISAISAFVSAIIAGIYTWLTFKIVKVNQDAVSAMKAQVLSASRPYVNFELVPDGTLIDSRLWNSGTTAAFNVNITTIPKLKATTHPLQLTDNNVSLIVPGQEYRELLGNWDELKQMTNSFLFTATLSYQDSLGNQYVDKLPFDLTGLSRIRSIPRPSIPAEVAKIASRLNDINERIGACVEKMTPTQ